MNYSEYFVECRKQYAQEQKPSLKSFYTNPVIRIPENALGDKYNEAVNKIATLVKKDFDKCISDDIMLKHDNLWKFEKHIKTMSDILVPYLEERVYGCNLYVDKIYIYRTKKLNELQSSYLWHYDNNPAEILKNIIYLNEVTEDNSPFEYLCNSSGTGIIVNPTRRGTKYWERAPNNSRITEEQIKILSKKGYNGKKVLGKRGLTICFNNNAIHRVNPIIKGYRDVINIRVKPTMTKAPEYVSRLWTTGFEKAGVVDKDPTMDWERYVR